MDRLVAMARRPSSVVAKRANRHGAEDLQDTTDTQKGIVEAASKYAARSTLAIVQSSQGQLTVPFSAMDREPDGAP
jgi:hypothetical protein